jgi:hypothetical protein
MTISSDLLYILLILICDPLNGFPDLHFEKTLHYEIRLKIDFSRKNEIKKNDPIMSINQVIKENRFGP